MKQFGVKLPQFQVNEIIDLLAKEKWVQPSAGGTWMLCRDLADVSLLDLYQLIPRRLPMTDSAQKRDRWTNQLHQLLAKQNEDLDKLLSIPLRDLLIKAEQAEVQE